MRNFVRRTRAGLSPGKDDKQQYAENTPFKAGSDTHDMLKIDVYAGGENDVTAIAVVMICGFAAKRFRRTAPEDVSPRTEKTVLCPYEHKHNKETALSVDKAVSLLVTHRGFEPRTP